MHAPPHPGRTASRAWDGFLAEEVPSLSPEELRSFENKRILITGAGGYLGSALARALSPLPVARLVLLDHAEYGLYRLEQDLRADRHSAEPALIVGSLGDATLMEELFAEHAPDIIFHAAALKHVPLMEDNAIAAAATNVLGTSLLVEAALKGKAESLVLLSTDKAVQPISIMGATKRIAEQLVLSARLHSANFNAIRLCNVLGSTGSVAPLFARQIASGGPVTVTDQRATRYFISQTSAVRYLLRSVSRRSSTGLSVPIPGEPHRIEDLARYMIDRAQTPEAAIKIVHTGLRLSDKLHEELVSPSESAEPFEDDPTMLAIQSGVDPRQLEHTLAQIRSAVAARDRVRLMQAIERAVPEYRNRNEAATLSTGEGA